MSIRPNATGKSKKNAQETYKTNSEANIQTRGENTQKGEHSLKKANEREKRTGQSQKGNQDEIAAIKEVDKYLVNIMVNNVAGLGVLTEKAGMILAWTEEKGVDVLLGQEANVSFRHPKIQEKLRGKGWTDVHMATSESEWVFENPNKPGGTFCISNNRMRSRVIKRINDTAGRWAGTIFLFKSGVKLAMISLYQVGKKAQSGVKTVYSQQNAWLRKRGRPEDPRTAMQRDLKDELQELKENNILVIIGGDFNDGDKTSGLHYMMSSEMGLHDAWELQNGPQTFRRGSECIDHIYMSQELKECVQSMEYLEYPSEFYTDHKPIQLKINMRSLQKTHILMPKAKSRKIISNDYKNVEIYITERYRLYEHYKIENTMKKLLKEVNKKGESNKKRNEELIKKLDRIDDNLTTISLQAEKMIKRRPKYYKTQRINELQVELTEIRYQISKEKNDKVKQQSLNRNKQRIIAEMRQHIKDQSEKRHKERVERLNDMIQNGTDAAKNGQNNTAPS